MNPTPEQMRIVIAEKCGWTYRNGVYEYDGEKRHYTIWIKDGKEYNPGSVPNYPVSLDAMHEVEKMLGEGHVIMTYMQHLGVISAKSGCIWNAVHATALQRTEAFCRTIKPELFS